MSAPTGRRLALLTAVRKWGGGWTSARADALYRANGWLPVPGDTAADLRALAADGWLRLREGNAPDYVLAAEVTTGGTQ